MNLYIKQKIFSLGDNYIIYDETKNPVYYVESELFSFLAKLKLTNTEGKELFYIKQNFTFLYSEYEVYKENNLFAVITKNISFFKPSLSIKSDLGNFEIEGSIYAYNFKILCNNKIIGYVEKQFLTWGDTYKLTIEDDTNADFFVALVITIDNSIHNDNNH